MAGTIVRFDQQALHTLLRSEQGDIAKDLARRAIQVDRAAKQLCPVDTGRLRSSITWELGQDIQGLLAVIGTNVTYAPFVELGTRKASAQPYLRPALAAGAR